MTLVRLFARPMLAAIFVIHGARTVKDPDPLVPVAKPVTDRAVPALKKAAPEPIAARIPESPRTLVRLNGAVQLAGGVALITGKYRRAGALALAGTMVPTTLAGHAFWEQQDPEQRGEQQIHFLKNLGLLGGLLITAVDTEGKPGLAWRAQHGTKQGTKKATKASKSASRQARREVKAAKRAARREAKTIAAKTKSAV